MRELEKCEGELNSQNSKILDQEDEIDEIIDARTSSLVRTMVLHGLKVKTRDNKRFVFYATNKISINVRITQFAVFQLSSLYMFQPSLFTRGM